MALSKTLVLITGANSGIGFELARQLMSDPSKHVILGSRSAEKGATALKDLQSQGLPGAVELLQIDVSSEDSIASAVQEVESRHDRLDALVNNAGIASQTGSVSESMAHCFQVNAIGTHLTAEAFAPLLQKSSGTPRLVSVSSGAGSIGRRLDANLPFHNMKVVPYRVSKSAMNMVTACQVAEYGPLGFKVFTYNPGFTVSNLGPHNNAESGAQPTSEAAAPIVDILDGKRDADHGKYLDKEEGYYPW